MRGFVGKSAGNSQSQFMSVSTGDDLSGHGGRGEAYNDDGKKKPFFFVMSPLVDATRDILVGGRRTSTSPTEKEDPENYEIVIKKVERSRQSASFSIEDVDEDEDELRL